MNLAIRAILFGVPRPEESTYSIQQCREDHQVVIALVLACDLPAALPVIVRDPPSGMDENLSGDDRAVVVDDPHVFSCPITLGRLKHAVKQQWPDAVRVVFYRHQAMVFTAASIQPWSEVFAEEYRDALAQVLKRV